MAHVVLNEASEVIGIFSLPQPQIKGYAEIADDDPRIDAYHEKVLSAPGGPHLMQTQMKS
jgi:hypothetical protein